MKTWKLALLTLLILFFASNSAAQIQTTGPSSSQDNAGSPDTHVRVTLTSVTSGSLIVCAWGENRQSGTNSLVSVADPTNGTYTSYGQATFDIPSVGQIVGIHYFPNAAAGTYQITATFSQSATFGAMACKAYPGAATSSVLDVTTTPRGATSTNPACNSMTTTANGDLIVSAISTLNLSPTAGSGFTIRESMTNTFYWYEDQIQSTAGSITPNWTNASSDTYGCIAAAFKKAAGGSNFNGNPSETLSPSQSVTVTMGRKANPTENLSPSQSVTAPSAHFAAPSYTASPSQSVTATTGRAPIVSENHTTTDAVATAGVWGRSVAETLSPSQSVFAGVPHNYFVSVNDVIKVESLTTTDAINVVAGHAAQAQVTLTTNATVTASLNTSHFSWFGNVSEFLSTVDSAGPCTQTNCLVENLTTIATVTAIKNTHPTWFGNVGEFHTTVDTISAPSAHLASAVETFFATQSTTAIAGHFGNVSVTLSPSQSVSISGAFVRFPTENHTTTDVIGVAKNAASSFTASVSETKTTVDSVARLAALNISLSETNLTADLVAEFAAHFAVLSDTVSVTDGSTGLIGRGVLLTETLTHSDSILISINRANQRRRFNVISIP